MYTKDPERIFDMILRVLNHLETKAERAETAVDDLTTEGDTLLERIDNLIKEKDNTATERDLFAVRLARVGSQAGRATNEPRKLTKIPDPPMFSDGKNPTFEDWALAIYQKLDANADHYSTATLRKVYVTSRCKGDARRHFVPRLRPESLNPYNNAKDMLAHLKTIFIDPNKVRNARRQYNDLKIAPGNMFYTFISDFRYLAVEAGIDADYWKEDLYQRLPTKLQELTITRFNDRQINFDQYIDECARSADLIDEILKRRN
jgi:hypothetical protein